jgi:bifunctional DNase/RNase
VERVLVTECTNTIFYARVHAVNNASGCHVDVDARPSDAINFAMRQGASLFVHRDVVRQYAKTVSK